LQTTQEKASSFFSSIPELDFDKKNVNYILSGHQQIEIEVPGMKDRQAAIERIEKQERQITNSDKLQISNIYDYDESTINERQTMVIRGMKYIEILSKTLPDFIHLMNGTEIEQYINGIYQFPNKLLFYVLKPFDGVFDLNTEELKELVLRNGKTEEFVDFDLNEFKGKVKQLSSTLILNIYDVTARLVASPNTIFALEKFSYLGSTNHMIQNAMIYENLQDTKKMGERLEKIADKNEKNGAIFQTLKRILFKHCVFNKLPYYGYNQHLIDRFLKVDKKKLAMIRMPSKK
jgi:hypothetical protein